MTDLLIRPDEPAAASAPQPAERAGRAAPAVALAALSAAAGAIHLVMVPSHMDEWAPEGIAFAAAGWFQLAVAAALVAAPRRALVRVALWANVAFLAAWMVTRTTGLPFGPDSGVAQDVGAVDATCAALEAAFVVLAVFVLAGRGRPSFGRVPTAVVALAALVAATAAIASPSARNHAHAGGDARAEAHGHGDGDTSAEGDLLGMGALQNGHHDEITVKQLDPATQVALDAQLDVTRQVAATYQTLQSALDAGYRRAGPYSPGLGVHVVRPSGPGLNGDGRMDPDNLLNPMSIIYDGVTPDSRVAGFMYYSASDAMPEGFAGGNDHWHYHTNVCITREKDGSTGAPLGADRSSTREECDAFGGILLAKTQWMVHVWTARGYEVPDSQGGVFAEVNPDLRCSDGTYFTMPVSEWGAHPLNVCRSELKA